MEPTPSNQDKLKTVKALIDRGREDERKNIQASVELHSQKFINFFGWWVYTTIFAFICLAVFLKIPEGNQRVMDLATGALISNGLPIVLSWGFRTTKSATIDKLMGFIKKDGNKQG